MEVIKWGFIGCGDVTEKKSGPAFNKVGGSEICAVMRRTASKARDYAKRHGIPKWYDDADKLINDPEVNAVYVATPPGSHAEYAIKTIDAGKPVYVEKPMAAKYKECVEMNKAASKNKLPLFVAYYRRALPYFLKVKELIEKQIIGNINLINIKYWSSPRQEDYNKGKQPWRLIPELSGGGYFYDLACHTLDILDYIFGPVKDASGRFLNKGGLYNVEDTVSASLEFESGIAVSGSWNFIANRMNETDVVEVLGSKGKIMFSTFAFTPIVVTGKDIITKYNPANPENIQYYLIKSIVEELHGKGKCPSDGVSAARTNRVMDLILNKV
jgi:predicted dehydrogenase